MLLVANLSSAAHAHMQAIMQQLEVVLEDMSQMCLSPHKARQVLPTLGPVEPSKPGAATAQLGTVHTIQVTCMRPSTPDCCETQRRSPNSNNVRLHDTSVYCQAGCCTSDESVACLAARLPACLHTTQTPSVPCCTCWKCHTAGVCPSAHWGTAASKPSHGGR